MSHAVWELQQAEMNVGRLQREIDRMAAEGRKPKILFTTGHGEARIDDFAERGLSGARDLLGQDIAAYARKQIHMRDGVIERIQ